MRWFNFISRLAAVSVILGCQLTPGGCFFRCKMEPLPTCLLHAMSSAPLQVETSSSLLLVMYAGSQHPNLPVAADEIWLTWINQHMPIWKGSKLPAFIMPVCCNHICKMCSFSVHLSPALRIARAGWDQPAVLVPDPSCERGSDGCWGYRVSGNRAETAGFALFVASIRVMHLTGVCAVWRGGSSDFILGHH